MAADDPAFQPTDRTRVRQTPQRACYDRETIFAILDEGLVCHVGFVCDGRPFVMPMNYARLGERLVVHLSHNSRLYKTVAAGADLCVTVTLLDGLVFAKSATHHSVNYRSVVVVGQARAVHDEREKLGALRALVEHAFPGRWDEVRATTDKEARATAVLEIPITEASAKVRGGPPSEDARDVDLPVWSGEIPLGTAMMPPVPGGIGSAPVPASVAAYVRPGFVRVNKSQGA